MTDSVERLSRALEGRYLVQREIGEGGMATVYLADDLKHERQVALKVLKPELTAVVGAERFLAEIKTTANLQHPHVLPLFDSGEAGGFLFYVMPYVHDGETLRDRLEREGQLSVGESVRIATAVAGALDYAHRHGVIHRDVKPANILLQDGEPVVADFGIALAVGAAGGSRLTETGLSLGTPYYMSPEQATGDQTVGPPSDLYSLGCVLYEMLVGEPPYVGNSAQAVLGKIISGAVVSPAEQRRSIPPNVDAAIRKGLEKVPADRFASAHAFAEALADPSYRYGEPVGITTAAGRSWKRLALAGWALAAVAVAAHGWSLARPSAPAPVTRVSVFVPEDQRLSGPGFFDLAPDGTFLVYTGMGEADGSLALWVRRWDALSATRIPGTLEALGSRISPDGREVAFFDPVDGAIRIVPLQGGMSRTAVADSLTRFVLGWSPDGEWIYFQAGLTAELRRAPAAGGDGVPVVRLDSATTNNNTWFDILPDGSKAVVEVTYATGPTVQLVDLETGEARHLTQGQFPRYAGGRLLFGSPDGTTLMAAPFDPGRGELTGPAVPVAEGVRSPASWNYFSVAGDGTLVYATGAPPSVDHEIVRVDRQGQVAPIDPSFAFDPGPNNRGLSLSPDGRRLAVTIFEDDNYDIWIKELPRGPLSRLTFDPAWDVRPRWTPDGRAVTFLSTRDNPSANDAAVWSKLASGTRPEEKVMDHELPIWEAEHSPDMTWLIGRTGGQTTVAGGRDVWAVRPGADTVSRPLVVTGFDEKAIGISPDGRWLLYESDETGRNEIYVRPFPDVEGGKWTVSTGGGVMPRWARSGGEVFYVNASGEMVSARVETDDGFRVLERSVLFPLPRDILFRQGEQYALYDVTPDGDGFVMFRRIEDEEASTELVLVRNWTGSLGGG